MKWNRQSAWLFFFAGLILLPGCGKKKDTTTGPGNVDKNYIPYQVGNTWSYQVTPMNGDPQYTSTVTVVARVKEKGVEMAVVEERSTKSPEDFSLIYYQTTANSLLMHKIGDFDPETEDTLVYAFDPPATWLKIPFAKDDSWQVFEFQGDPSSIPLLGSGFSIDSTYAGLTVKITLAGKTLNQENVSAAGKDFQAFKVDFDFTAEVIGLPLKIPGKLGSFWIVPNVGIARITFYNLDGSIKELRTLTDYTLK